MKSIVFITLALGVCLSAAETSREERTFPAAAKLTIDNLSGGIAVTGYSGKEIRMEAVRTVDADSAERYEAARREVKLDISQQADALKILVDGPFRCHCNDGNNSIQWRGRSENGYDVRYEFHLQVPYSTEVDLRTINHGDLMVEKVTGDFVLRNVNGGIELREAGGSGKATTVNGPVRATFARNPERELGFKSVNGKIDLSFPDGLKAEVRLKTLNGGMFTDFEAEAAPLAAAASTEQSNGRFVYRRDHSAAVRIGGGGPALTLETLNGNIYIRKREK